MRVYSVYLERYLGDTSKSQKLLKMINTCTYNRMTTDEQYTRDHTMALKLWYDLIGFEEWKNFSLLLFSEISASLCNMTSCVLK
jgi:hypothetical protein